MKGYLTKGKTFKVFITVDTSGEYPKVVPDVEEEKLKESPNLKREWAEFYRWDFKDSNRITQESTEIDIVSGKTKFNWVKINELKLRYLLKDWSLVDEDGKKIEVKRNATEVEPSSFEKVLSVDFTVLNAFLNKANEVLEFGGEAAKNFTKKP